MPHTLPRIRGAPVVLAAALLLLSGCGGGGGTGTRTTGSSTTATSTTATATSTTGGTTGGGTPTPGATTVLGTEHVTDAAGIALGADQVDELVADCQGGAGVPGPDTTCTLVLPIVLAPCTPDTKLCLMGGISTSGTGVLVLVDRRPVSVCTGDGAALCGGVTVPVGVVRSLGAALLTGTSGTGGGTQEPGSSSTGAPGGTSADTTTSSTRPPAAPGATTPTRLPGTRLPPLSPPTPATRVPLPTRETLTLTPTAPLLSGSTPTGTGTP